MGKRFAVWGIILVLMGCGGEITTGDSTAAADDQRTAESARHHVNRISTISYAPNSFIIGNAYPGWTMDAQGEPSGLVGGPGNPNGAHYRWGYFYGPHFDRCAWVNANDIGGTVASEGSSRVNDWFSLVSATMVLNRMEAILRMFWWLVFSMVIGVIFYSGNEIAAPAHVVGLLVCRL